MKKLIYTIGMLMFLSAPLRPWISFAEEALPASDPVTCNPAMDPACADAKSMEYALAESPNKNLDWGSSFGETDPTKVGQNIYLMVYKKAQVDTFSEAITATAKQYGLPPERMSLILGGNITPIMERSPLMTIAQATTIYSQMVATYNEKKDSADVQAKIKAKVEPNEMFSDGDLANSGFDLVNDLNNIETILFQKADVPSFGGVYDSSTDEEGTGSAPVVPGGPTDNNINAPIPVDIDGPDGGSSGGNNQSGGQKEIPKNPFLQADENKSSVFAGGVNPNQCFATQDLDKALDNFAKNAQTNSKLKNSFDPAKDLPKTQTSGTQNNGTGSSGGTGIDVPVPTATTPATTPDVPEAPAGDYSADPLCADILCLTIDFVMKPATPAFNKTDNCIQCHVQYINDSMQKTLSHSLIPGKASGNLGESGLCKKAAAISMGSVGMNVSINIVPIITPVKNDLMTLGNITDEWDKYAAKNGGWNYDEKKRRGLVSQATGKPADISPIITDMERMLQVEIMNTNDSSSIGQTMAKAAEGYNAQKAQQTQQQLVAEVAKDAYGEIDTLKALDEQMKQMNQFFEGYQKQIRTLTEKVPGLNSTLACEKLKSKAACT